MPKTPAQKNNKKKQKQLPKKYTKLLSSDSFEKQHMKQQRILSKSVLDSLRSSDKNRFNLNSGYDTDALLDASNNSNNDEEDDDDESNYDETYDENDDDQGTIHPYGPGIDPKLLLHSLTEQDETKILTFNSNNALLVTRTPNPDRKGGPLDPVPGAPREVQAQIIKPRFVTLKWQEPFKNADEITSYSVYYKLPSSERYFEISIHLNKNIL